MSIFKRLFGKREDEPYMRSRIEISPCEYCQEMLYEGDKIELLIDKKLHEHCIKELKREAKKLYG